MHGAVVQVHQSLHQAESDAESAFDLIDGGLSLRENLEDARQHLGLDPDAFICNANDRLCAFEIGIQPNHSVRFRILGGVGQQVGNDLRKP